MPGEMLDVFYPRSVQENFIVVISIQNNAKVLAITLRQEKNKNHAM